MKLVCSDGQRQAQSATLCEEWFDYDTGNHIQFIQARSDAATVTSKAKAWLSRNGIAQTKSGMCSAFAPWPLDNKNDIEVRAVCQIICDYCKNGYLVTKPPTLPTKPPTPKLIRTTPTTLPTMAVTTMPPIFTTNYYTSPTNYYTSPTNYDYYPTTTISVWHYAGTFGSDTQYQS